MAASSAVHMSFWLLGVLFMASGAQAQIISSTTTQASVYEATSTELIGTTTQEIQDFASSTFEGTPLNDIAICESGRRMYDANNDVLIHHNLNGSLDIGYLQINSVHLKEADNMGFDLYSVRGNLWYGLYLYRTRGIGQWVCSSTLSSE